MITWQHGLWLCFFSRRTDKVWQFVASSMLSDYIYLLVMILMLANNQISQLEILQMTPAVFLEELSLLYPWAVVADILGHPVVI